VLRRSKADGERMPEIVDVKQKMGRHLLGYVESSGSPETSREIPKSEFPNP